ncbi:MAG: DUF4215 domain-containing protein [Kofleriaceae bacterium]
MRQTCGDRLVDRAEVCDDGNVEPDDGCSRDCQSTERCGDGIVDLERGEQCDDAGIIGLANDGCASGCAQELALWEDTDPLQPSPRGWSGLVSDPLGGVMLFGGLAGLTSSQVQVTGPLPASIAGSFNEMACSATRCILFGGTTRSPSSSRFDDTWEWDGTNWRQLATPVAPTGVAFPILVHMQSTFVLFGGWSLRSEMTTMRFENTTYLLSDSSSSWVTSPATPPDLVPKIAGANIPIGVSNGTDLLVTQRTSLGNQMWRFNGSSWAALTGDAVAVASSIAFDGGRNTIVVTRPGSPVLEYTNVWTTKNPARVPARTIQAAAFDVSRGRSLVLADSSSSEPDASGGLWSWNGAGWKRLTGTPNFHASGTDMACDLSE